MIGTIDFNSVWTSPNLPKIVFGKGEIKQLPKICKELGNNCVILYSASIKRTGLLEKCQSLCNKDGITIAFTKAIIPEPDIHQVNHIVGEMRNHNIDFIIAIGGGSVLDAGKAVAVISLQGGFAEDYLLGGRIIGKASIPLIAVPSVAGSGSELSRGAILTYPEKKKKAGIRSGAFMPHTAIVDPELTLTLPLEQVKISGFDILTHAIETLLSKKSTLMTEVYSLYVIENVCKVLPKALLNLGEIVPRIYLSFCSMLMGYNLANSSTCLPHRLQYPVGAITGVAHAVGLAALYPAWASIIDQKIGKEIIDLKSAMQRGLSLNQMDLGFPELINYFFEIINLKINLSDMKITEKICHDMSEMVEGFVGNDPIWNNDQNLITKIYLNSL